MALTYVANEQEDRPVTDLPALFVQVDALHQPGEFDDNSFALLPGHRVPISIGTDTHDDLDRLGDLRGMHEFVARRGLSERLFRPATAAQPAATAAVAAR